MTSRLLAVQSSARTEGSLSRLLVDEFAAQLRAQGGHWSQTTRDLISDPVPVLQPGVVEAIRAPQPDATQRRTAALSETLIDELKASDLIVIGAPMYNWSIPAALKAWIDQIVRFGFTFGHGSKGVEGLLGGRPAIVIMTRGGVYSTPEKAANDFQKPYLKTVLSAIGLQPEFVLCEGTLLGGETLSRSLEQARSELKQLATHYSR